MITALKLAGIVSTGVCRFIGCRYWRLPTEGGEMARLMFSLLRCCCLSVVFGGIPEAEVPLSEA